MLGSGGFDAARVRARPAHGLVRERGQYLYVTSGIGTSGVPLRWRRIRGAGCDRAVCRCYGHCWGSNRVFVRVDSVTDDTIYRPSKPRIAVNVYAAATRTLELPRHRVGTCKARLWRRAAQTLRRCACPVSCKRLELLRELVPRAAIKRRTF